MKRALEKIRKSVFWFWDCIHGCKVRNHYNDVSKINGNFGTKDSERKRMKYLEDVISHATNTTPFYSDISPNLPLKDFPVINKSIIKENFEDFISEKYKDKPLHQVSTSGSTGTPFSLFHDKNKKNRNTADTIFFAKKDGFQIGEKLVYIRLWDEQHTKSKTVKWVQNIMNHNIFDLKDSDIQSLIDKLESDNSNKGIIAYASAYDAICHYLDKKNYGPVNANVHSVIAMSETLSEYAKKGMKKYFGVPATSRYSNVENGIIAQQCEDCNGNFKINWASYIVEVLDINEDKHAKEGEVGRIVITDLFNFAMPMLRYDTGDLGILKFDDDCGEYVLSNIEGRKMDMLYNTNGELITSHVVHQICLYEGINQYQLIQNGKRDYLFKMNVSKKFDKEKELISLYQTYFGNDAKINIEYVNDIPLLSSGKRKKVLNRFYT
ncbi:phenylacetate--CoA ligase family protein [Urechidicola croceus]|uniref:CoF synthetase n=1 Tax=Urechidicola croceus TaxID=1850246 RepID=A0A1D8P685_9FLAO|nr:phenylacetate--CoA ligase family protein [Urechidicola croceus]AOW20095.1 hypothetical protein LPB138_05100 [Urechidicola croceus]